MKTNLSSKLLACVLSLALLLSALPAPVIAEGAYSCGLTEHTHTDACYATQLICQENHEHTDECYQTLLTCGLTEHTHTDECAAPAETPAESAAASVKALFEAILTDYFSGCADAAAVSQAAAALSAADRAACGERLDEAMDAYDALSDEETEQFDADNAALLELIAAITSEPATAATPTAELTVPSISVEPGETSGTGTLTLSPNPNRLVETESILQWRVAY